MSGAGVRTAVGLAWLLGAVGLASQTSPALVGWIFAGVSSALFATALFTHRPLLNDAAFLGLLPALWQLRTWDALADQIVLAASMAALLFAYQLGHRVARTEARQGADLTAILATVAPRSLLVAVAASALAMLLLSAPKTFAAEVSARWPHSVDLGMPTPAILLAMVAVVLGIAVTALRFAVQPRAASSGETASAPGAAEGVQAGTPSEVMGEARGAPSYPAE